MVRANYVYRLRVTPTQERQMQSVFDACRFTWNHHLGRWSDLWKYEREGYSWLDALRELTDMRHTYEWLGGSACKPQQQTIRTLFRSIDSFLKGQRPRPPRFKKKGAHATAEWTRHTIRGNRLILPIGSGERVSLRVIWSRPLPSVTKTVRVYRDAAGRWFASFPVEVEAEEVAPSGTSTGLDVGLTTYATTECEDADVANPRFARRAAKALARSQRNMARKKKGSNNRKKARKTVAKVHAKTKDQRIDFAHQEARKLARRFDRIGVEDLRVRNMVRNRHLSRSISDAGWGRFLTTLEWHARKCGREVVRFDPRNTTQTCSECGVIAKQRLGLADRTFSCADCGFTDDRDRNAARNLNPNRRGQTGEGVDGSKTAVPAGTAAA